MTGRDIASCGGITAATEAASRWSVAAWPLAAQVAVAVVVGDLLVYRWHRTCHEVPVLWRFQAVHHTSQSLDWLAAHREHPLDAVTTRSCKNLPAMVLALSLREVGAVVALRGAWGGGVHPFQRPTRRRLAALRPGGALAPSAPPHVRRCADRKFRESGPLDRRRLCHLRAPDRP